MRSLACYLASASSEPDISEVERYMLRLRQKGHGIVHDWTSIVRKVGSGSPGDTITRFQSAIADLHAVERCDVFWLLHPQGASTGAWVELGHALAFKKVRKMLGVRRPLIVVSGATEQCIFADAHDSLVDHRFALESDAHEKAFAHIVAFGEGAVAEESIW